MKLKNIFKKKDKPNQSRSVLDTMVPAANNHSTARRAGDSIASQKNKVRVEDKQRGINLSDNPLLTAYIDEEKPMRMGYQNHRFCFTLFSYFVQEFHQRAKGFGE